MNENEEKNAGHDRPPRPRLKLFVLGEESGDPDDWSKYGDRAFVMAETSEQALALHDRFSNGPVAEVCPSEPRILYEDGFESFI
jgi:hypothetical protein